MKKPCAEKADKEKKSQKREEPQEIHFSWCNPLTESCFLELAASAFTRNIDDRLKKLTVKKIAEPRSECRPVSEWPLDDPRL